MFLSMSRPEVVTVVEASVKQLGSEVLPKNFNWDLTNLSSKVVKSPHNGNYEAVFTIEFIRKSDYFVTNLIVPLVLLHIPVLSCFMIPYHSPDRAMFAATILLSMFVHQSEIMSNLPKTPQPIYIAYYSLGATVFAMTCTVYATIMCFIDNFWPSLSSTPTWKRANVELSRLALADLIVFVVFVSVCLILNLVEYTLVV